MPESASVQWGIAAVTLVDEQEVRSEIIPAEVAIGDVPTNAGGPSWANIKLRVRR